MNRWSGGWTIRQVCRVCGINFRSRRFDAITCSSTCRQRLKRGQALAYLDGLTKRQQKIERELHEAIDEHIASHRELVQIVRSRRAEKRAARQERQRQQMLTEVMANVTRERLRSEQEWEWRKLSGALAGVLKLFAQERRNDMSAQAICDFLQWGDRVEEVAEALDRLRASGDYDRIIAEAINPPSDAGEWPAD